MRQKAKALVVPISSPGFDASQLCKLQKPLDQKRVHLREIDGRQLSHIEGWYAIAQANEIFGYAAWDRETVFLERVQESAMTESTTCGYIARIRIRVRAGTVEVTREGTGCGFATARSPAAAHERAVKSAETDATKRALATFGAQFGLDLYDKERALSNKAPLSVLFGPDGRPIIDNLSPEAFLKGLRQLIEKCQRAPEISALLLWNTGCLTGLRNSAPDLRNAQGKHYTDLLLHLAERLIRRLEQVNQLADESQNITPMGPGLPSPDPTPSQPDRTTIKPAHSQEYRLQGSASHGPVSIGVGFAVPDPTEASVTSAGTGEQEAPRGETPRSHQNARHDVSTQSISRIGPGERIDKSTLPIGLERRLRSKLHLKRVAELPCLICNRQPSHAHHIKYAQRRGMSQKVSDEFVVPLCALHHGDLHRAGSEKAWWEKQGQEPLAIAAGLWDRFGRNLN